MIELIEMAENTQHLNYYKLWYIFVFWNISLKVCNNACIIPRFGKYHFIHFYSVFKR